VTGVDGAVSQARSQPIRYKGMELGFFVAPKDVLVSVLFVTLFCVLVEFGNVLLLTQQSGDMSVAGGFNHMVGKSKAIR